MAKKSLLLQTCYYDCFQYFSYVAKNKDAFVAAHADRKNAVAEKEPAKKN